MTPFELPQGYEEIRNINLQKNIKLTILINGGALVIGAAMFCIGTFFVPFTFDIFADNPLLHLAQLFGMLIAIVLYMLAHELIHGIFIKKYSGKKAKYGFTGLYAFAGSDAYFNKSQYIVIALAPVVFFGIVFLLLNIFLPANLFWPIYFMQIMNLSGAAGDFYITALACRLPSDILTRDSGVSMKIYSRTK